MLAHCWHILALTGDWCRLSAGTLLALGLYSWRVMPFLVRDVLFMAQLALEWCRAGALLPLLCRTLPW